MKKEIIAAMGLIVGAVLGIVGSFAPTASLRGIAWGIDGTTIIVGCAIMTIHFLRSGNDMLAAGFIVYAIGEGLVQLVCAMAPDSSSPFFAAGTALWAAGMAMVSFPRGFPAFVRGTGVIAGILFAVTALEIFSGNMLTPLSKPLPYLFLSPPCPDSSGLGLDHAEVQAARVIVDAVLPRSTIGFAKSELTASGLIAFLDA